MKLHRPLFVCALLCIAPVAAFAAPKMATPDPAMVARYSQDSSARAAKIAECKKKFDMVGIMTDVGCMSADAADRKAQTAPVTSKCGPMDIFVFVPPSITGKAVEAYLVKNSPSATALKNCGQTKDQWLATSLKAHQK